LEHPHIVRVLDYGVERKTPFLVMYYAPGGTLRQLHPKGTRLPLPTIVTYVKQVADALQYAHREKLIHRDVKPENMLMGRHNDVLLSDFGIAVIAHSTSSQKVETMAGTIAYTAPEQLQGHPRPASDQYSLGVVVYEWLCGDRPFQGTLTEVAMQHAMMPPPSLRQKAMEIPVEVEQVVMIALAKDPEQRFASVQAFAHALEQASLPNSQTVPVVSQVPDAPLPLPKHRSKVWTVLTDRISRRALLIGLSSLVVVGGGLTGVELASKPARGTLFHTFPQGDIVYAVAWSPDGTRFASADNTAGVQIWEAANGDYVLTYSGHTPGASAVAWSPDGQYIASAGSDATVQVWEALTKRKIIPTIQTGHTGYIKVVNAVAWSPDGKYLASAGEDGYVKVWDAMTGHLKYTYNGHIGQNGGSSVNAVAWSPDSMRIASASSDYTVQVWDATTGHHVFPYPGHSGEVQAVAWSPDGSRLASGSADQTVQVWSPSASGALRYSGHSNSVEAVAWSSDGQHLASGSDDMTVRVWDLSSTGNPYVYRGHTDVVYAVAWSSGGFPLPWSHEGQRLASGGKDTAGGLISYANRNISNRFPYPGGPVGEALHLLARSHTGEYQYCAQAALDPGNNIGIHAIPDHHRFLGVRVDGAQGSTHHQRVRFADKVGLDARGRADQRGYSPGRRDDSSLARPHNIGICGNKTRASGHQADGTGNALKAIHGRLPQYHVLRVLVGQDIAYIMQCCRQPRLSDNIGASAGPLRVQELRSSQRGGEDRFRGHIQPHIGQPHLQVTRCVQRVIGKNQERNPLSSQALYKLGCSRKKCRTPHDDSIHIDQVILDTVHVPPSIVCCLAYLLSDLCIFLLFRLILIHPCSVLVIIGGETLIST